MNSEWQYRNCPLCDSDNSTLAVEAPLKAEEMSFPEVKNFWTGFVSKPCFFTYFRCNICGLLYNKFYFSESQLDLLYEQMKDNTDGVNLHTLRKTNSGYIKFVLRSISIKKFFNYLEIGPDIGLFSKPFTDNLQPKSAHFIEPNLSSHSILEENLSGITETLISNSLEDLMNQNENLRYQFVAGIHVFDHLIKPLDYLQKLRELSDNDSKVYSVTHNEKSWLRILMGIHWVPFCLQHPQLYNPDTLSQMFNKCSFEPISIKPTTNWFPVGHIFSVFTRLFTSRNIQIVSFLNFSIPLKLGNMQAIFQKK